MHTGTRTTRTLIPSMLVLALAALAARGAPPSPPPAEAAPPLSDYVGKLRVEAPAQDEFLLHGTLPIPRQMWLEPEFVNPLLVLDYNLEAVPTQTEVVSRYASPLDGVDVAEVIARVHRPPGAKTGDPLSYYVIFVPNNVTPPPVPSVSALLEGVSDVPASVKGLIQSASGLQIEALDPFGNRYLALPFDGTGTVEIMRHGPLTSEIKVSTSLKPSPVVTGPQGTLPHHLGVHAYITVSSEEEIIGLDLRFHNAHSGKDKTTNLDDPLDDVFFQSLNLYVPDGWFIIQDYFDPFLSLPTKVGTTQLFPLVSKNADGKMHPMKWLQQFHRRLAIAPVAKWPEAQAKLRGAGLGFATRGLSPDSGKPLWSWWNPVSSRWFPQAQRLPTLNHVAPGVVKQQLSKLFNDVVDNLQYGHADGLYPMVAGVLGYAHPYGIAYAGMTSGTEIYLVDGVPTVESGSLDGYRLARITHRMQTDRQPNVLYDGDGTPSTVKDWLIPVAGGKDYVPFQHFNLPQLSSQDPFGVWLAPTFQADYVQANDLEADYANQLFGFEAHDYQHLIRYTRSAKVLAWMANDSLAKDDLRTQAEMFHLSYHENFNSSGGYVQVSGLKAHQQHVASKLHSGLPFGRGEAWGLDAAVASYALGSTAWRAENRTWFDAIAKVVADGQMTCSGFIQSSHNEHFAGGAYRSRQIIEQSITENALRGLAETVYRGQDSARLKLVEDTVRSSLYSMLDPMAWGVGEDEPWTTTAVGPLDESLPVYCDISEMPPDGHTDYTDGYQNWSSFAYGFQMTNDIAFLERAQTQFGWPLFYGMLGDGTKNIENRAALLALIQGFAGI
jgi:hypothetical protein